MSYRNEWEQFFDSHAPVYMDNVFTNNTVEEIDFLTKELDLLPGCSVLDVGCGTGRHAVELARRGFRVVGVDISGGMLTRARAAAGEAGVEVGFVRADVSESLPEGPFDAALCLCEGAFGLIGSADEPLEHDRAILGNIRSALRPGAPLLMTVLNGMRHIRLYSDADVRSGRFDPLALIETSEVECTGADGSTTVEVREKGYVPSELALILSTAGFEVEHLWGGTAGRWGARQVELDEMEIMAVARRPGGAGS